MLRKLLRSAAPAPARWTVPDGERVYAIGDVHGCLGLLDDLLGQVIADDRRRGPSRTTLIFIGDLIDRGPQSAQVVERLRSLDASFAVRFLKGNHEELFLGAIAGDDAALRVFCRSGGRETAISYGLAPDDYDRLDYEELSAWLAEHVPAAHRSFLDAFEDLIVIGDYAFAHAGIRFEVPLTEQRARTLRWIREPFLSHRDATTHCVVHGHTITEQAEMLRHRIGVDTGAFLHGRLTALGLEGGDQWLLQAQN